jgi:hypothetical protein
VAAGAVGQLYGLDAFFGEAGEGCLKIVDSPEPYRYSVSSLVN